MSFRNNLVFKDMLVCLELSFWIRPPRDGVGSEYRHRYGYMEGLVPDPHNYVSVAIKQVLFFEVEGVLPLICKEKKRQHL